MITFSQIQNTFEPLTTGILTASVADHLAPFVVIPHQEKTKKKTALPKVRDMRDENVRALKQSLKDHDWSTLLNTNCVDTKTALLEQKLKEELNKHCPLKEVKPNKRKHPIQKWMTNGILVSRNTRQKLKDTWVLRRRRADYESFKDYNAVYCKVTRAAREMYHTKRLDEVYKDSRAMWQYTNEILSRKQRSQTEQSLRIKLKNGEITTDTAKIADEFNEFFASVGQKLLDSFPEENEDKFLEYMPDRGETPHHQEMKFLQMTEWDYTQIIKNMKAKKSTGFDEISNRLIKQLSQEIQTPMMDIINTSLCLGEVPLQWKVAKIIPLFKSGEKTDCNNYRPISLLSALSKILEKVVHKQTYDYLEQKVLTMAQFGFRRSRDTTQAILNYLQNIETKSNDKYHVSVFIDIKKAFDTVKHDILLRKLDILGIRGTENKWFKNYLTGRTQCTQVANSKSAPAPITCGVPQGSILGPLLFLVYINDMPNSTNLATTLYADDTTYQDSDNCLKMLEMRVNNELHKAEEWFKANYLTLHPSKTRFILHTDDKSADIELKLMGQQIARVGPNKKETAFKFLGVWIDQNLDWKEHNAKTLVKIRKLTYTMIKLKNSISKNHMSFIYKGLIKPVLEYGMAIWGHNRTKELNKAHKKIIRVINTKPKHSHAEPLLKDMNCLQLDDLYTQKVLEQLSKIRLKHAPKILHNYVEWHPDDHRRWYHTTTKVKLSKLERKLPKYHQCKVWNNTFDTYNCDLLHESTTARKLTQAYKIATVQKYYSYCELKNCYSCRQQKLIDDEIKAQKKAKQEAEAAERARIRQYELEEEYWYLMSPSELTKGHR